MPGRRTLPATSTVTVLAAAAASADGRAGEPASTSVDGRGPACVGTAIRLGLDRAPATTPVSRQPDGNQHARRRPAGRARARSRPRSVPRQHRASADGRRDACRPGTGTSARRHLPPRRLATRAGCGCACRTARHAGRSAAPGPRRAPPRARRSAAPAAGDGLLVRSAPRSVGAAMPATLGAGAARGAAHGDPPVDEPRRQRRGRQRAVSSGATQTASMPGPTWAPRTAPSSPHQTSRPSRFSASRSASGLGELPGAVGAGQVRDADVDLLVAGRLDGQLLQPARAPAPRCAPSPGSRPCRRRSAAAASPRAHRRAARPPHRSGRRGAGTPGCRRRTATTTPRPARRAASAASSARAAVVEHVGGRQRGVPGGHPHLPAVDAVAPGSDASRAASWADSKVPLMSPDRWIDTISVGAVAAGLLVDLEQRAGRRPRRADRPELLERLRRPRRASRRRAAALVVDLGADDDLQRHDDDAALGRHLRREAGRRVGDDHGPAWPRLPAQPTRLARRRR